MIRLFLLSATFLAGCGEQGSGPFGAGGSGSGLDADGDGWAAGSGVDADCDDGDAAVHPGADELCDGVDQDCDGVVDEDAVDASTWYDDSDGDGYGQGEGGRACEAPPGAVAVGGDCDDSDPELSPGQPEICNDVDDDCDGLVDEADDDLDVDAAYPDADGDGFGDGSDPTMSCDPSSDLVDNGDDCDDGDAEVGPGAPEACDNADNDCNGVVDDGLIGSGPACFAASCAAVATDQPDASDGLYWLDVDGTGVGEQHFCEMETDGGGWLLVAISADDGDASWTWSAREFWEDRGETFGDPLEPTADFRSSALPRAPMADLLAVHQPSGVWAAYHDVGDGTGSLGDLVADVGERVCWGAGTGWEIAAGSLDISGDLCSTRIYLNAADQDGEGDCPGGSDAQDTHGPSWSIDAGEGCGLDAPALAGFGADASAPSTERGGRGFGEALGLNTGAAGTGENRMLLYVR